MVEHDEVVLSVLGCQSDHQTHSAGLDIHPDGEAPQLGPVCLLATLPVGRAYVACLSAPRTLLLVQFLGGPADLKTALRLKRLTS